MKIVSCFCVLAGVLLMVGCGGEKDVAKVEARERGIAQLQQASEAEQAGNPGKAIELLERALLEEPKAFSAHFQLATLLQDHARDYMGAIYHYRQYLKNRPDSEKSKLAEDRIRVAEQLLAPQIMKRVGEAGDAAIQAQLLKDIDNLNKRIAELVGEKAGLSERNAESEKTIKNLQSENSRLRRIVDSVRAEAANAAIPEDNVSAREAAQREGGGMLRRPGERKTIDKSKFGDLKKMREEANALSAEGAALKNDSGVKSTASASDRPEEAQVQSGKIGDGEEFSLSALLKGSERKEKKATKRKYVVRPGETLYMLSERFYGTKMQWKRIRDANRATINPDGRLIAGQTLWIP